MQAAVSGLTMSRRRIVRSVDAGVLLERFLVFGVLALLGLRFYLAAAGYPQVGGRGLHIAHMLWGGLLMLTAIVLMLAFLGRTALNLASALGGIGFGIFIDELGKFITTDNNYFFRPAIAIIYVIFVLLFLVFRAIERRQALSEEGYLVNALDLTKEAILHGLDEEQRRSALHLLDRCNDNHPFVEALRAMLEDLKLPPVQQPNRISALIQAGRQRYLQIVDSSWFSRFVVGLFLAYAAVSVLVIVGLIVAAGLAKLSSGTFTISADGDVGSSAVADVFIIIGAFAWRRSRLHGYTWFKRALLVSILLTQPFLFYSQQLTAVVWLAVSLVMFEAVNYAIRRERPQVAAAFHA